MPKFLVDESAGKDVASELKKQGFDAIYVGDIMVSWFSSRKLSQEASYC